MMKPTSSEMPTNLQETEKSSAGEARSSWHLELFKKSVLKQAKLREIRRALPENLQGKDCLDLGSDNGVISYYLRKLGGRWSSADLTEQAVESITSLVAERVLLIDGVRFPYEDNAFDVVVVVDMLEHVEDDRIFARELKRILRSDGLLIINAPNLLRGSLLRVFRHLIGQTDEAHGHLRPGYSVKQLRALFEDGFELLSSRSYSRFFSEFVDTMIVFSVGLLGKLTGKKESSSPSSEGEPSKGLVITGKEMKRFQKTFRLYSLIYPAVWLFSRLDYLVFFLPGYMRITRLRLTK